MKGKFTFKDEAKWLLITSFLFPVVGLFVVLIFWLWTAFKEYFQ